MEKKQSLLIIGGTGFFGKSILDSFKRGLLKEFNINKILVWCNELLDKSHPDTNFYKI